MLACVLAVSGYSDGKDQAKTPDPKQPGPAPETVSKIKLQPAKFVMADPNKLPYPKENRRNYSVRIGGGSGVVVAPHWVMTAKHCITSSKEESGKVRARFRHGDKNNRIRNADLVVRHKSKDIALVRLIKPFDPQVVTSPLLLKDMVVNDKRIFIKKVSASSVWNNIPAHGKGDKWFIAKDHRKGSAGTSGSPWLVHSTTVGDVLVGITHGSGRSPQIGFLKDWIAETVAANSQDALYWATAEQAFVGQEEEQKRFQERTAAESRVPNLQSF